ncbi:hypothetical protein B296_00037373 [Ensete ventricosum]|uniref:DUF4005 domain-containing protein n=1 Tax=Ensete ventricosum TaxID=4639 RepID=A0A426ZZJ7_ENSVE|nr:hypothetical protein B296_00037373 [Ensete ventricosum]
MGQKGKWVTAVKRALICNCCQGEQRENLGKSKHSDPLPAKEVETATHDAAQPLSLAPIEGVKLTETGDGESKHAYSVALASAVAAEAAAVAAEAAAEVVRPTTSMTRLLGESREEIAAIKIQAAFRGCLVYSLKCFYPFSLAQWNSSSRSSTTVPTDPSNPQWGWNWLQRWMAARPWETHRTTETKDDATIKIANCSTVGQTMKRHDTSMERTPSAAQKSSRPPSHQSPATPQSKQSSIMNRKKSVSPIISQCSADDDSRSMLSLQSEQPRRHSSSTRDNESLVSSVSLPSYMASTESVRARSPFLSPQSDRHGTLKGRLICSVKKRLSVPMADMNSISPPARIPKVENSPVKDVALEKEQEANN